MSRLFWVGTGVALTVFVIVKGRKIVLQYTPEAVAERATAQAADFTSRATEAAGGLWNEFKEAFSEREAELKSSLLAETQGSLADLRARREASKPRPTAADFPDVDPVEDELGYSF
jgi:hypothetical protein